jgi:gluconolactonase
VNHTPPTPGPAGLDRLEVFAEGLDHSEGIAILPEGTIYTGGEAGQIFRIGDDDAPVEVANTGGFVLGIAADAEGRLYACDDALASVLRIDPATGQVDTLATGLDDRPMHSPNWPAFDGAGNLYVSNSGGWGKAEGLIWVVRPGGRLEIWTEQSADFPNGVAVAPDGSRLYAVESNPGRIIEIPIADDGSAGRRRVLCELGLTVPDGVAVAADGSLVVACYRPDVIYRWSEGDGLDVLACDPQGTILSAPTNVAFTGPDLETLVCPNLAGWHLVRGDLGVRGTPLFRPTADQLEG